MMNRDGVDDGMDAFFRDKEKSEAALSQGYRALVLAEQPDNARIEAIEIAVAEGILRWMARQTSINYDYWLIFFGVVGDEPWTTETWPKLRMRLWKEMEAWKWLHFRDCWTSDGTLWQRATLRVQTMLFRERAG